MIQNGFDKLFPGVRTNNYQKQNKFANIRQNQQQAIDTDYSEEELDYFGIISDPVYHFFNGSDELKVLYVNRSCFGNIIKSQQEIYDYFYFDENENYPVHKQQRHEQSIEADQIQRMWNYQEIAPQQQQEKEDQAAKVVEGIVFRSQKPKFNKKCGNEPNSQVLSQQKCTQPIDITINRNIKDTNSKQSEIVPLKQQVAYVPRFRNSKWTLTQK